MAQERDLDLVEMNPNSDPPLCKLMDFGKFKYDQSKNSKQVQKVRKIKEVKLRPKTERHDLDVKLKRARNFLEDGHKVLAVYSMVKDNTGAWRINGCRLLQKGELGA
jgi:translation initiation factor IF-3